MINLDGVVSLFIFCIELILLINLFIFSERNKTNKIIFLLIIILAVYQLLEFLMCTLGLKYSFTAYLAFADISFLPPLNLFFILLIAGYKNKYFPLLFLPAVLLTAYYTFVINKFVVVSCSVFYASYNYPLGGLYGFFYYVPVIASLIILYIKAKDKTNNKSLYFKILFYGLSITALPVVAAFILKFMNYNSFLTVIESVMCKFAFVYALSLGYFALNNKKAINE